MLIQYSCLKEAGPPSVAGRCIVGSMYASGGAAGEVAMF